MKKIVSTITGILLVSFIFGPLPARALTGSVDQSCTTGTEFDLISGATTNREQTFKPTKNRLTGVVLYIGGQSMAGESTITVTILNEPGTKVLGSAQASPTVGDGPEGRLWEFSSITLVPEQTYIIRVQNSGPSNLYWYKRTNCYSRGEAFGENAPLPWDYNFQTYGYNYSTTTTPTTTTKTTTTTTPTKTTAAAPVVAPNKLAVPLNFRVDNNGDNQIVFAWDKNKEADLAGYVLYVYEAQKEVETEIIDINDKLLDNYNLDLAGHPKLSKDKEYDVKLAAKNTAGAVSEKTLSLRVKFEQPAPEVVVQDAKTPWFQNPYIWGGLGFLLVTLLALLFFMERKFHGISKLFNKKQ